MKPGEVTMIPIDSYVYKKEVDWSLLIAGVTLPREFNILFGMVNGRMMKRGEKKTARFILAGREYTADIKNMNNPVEKRPNDQFQLRYSVGSDIAAALREIFWQSYSYLKPLHDGKQKGSRQRFKLPEGKKEYLAIYTTEYEDTFLLETITCDDISDVREEIKSADERQFETDFTNGMKVDVESIKKLDPTVAIKRVERITKIRQLDRSIGNTLKRQYNYRCQICGRLIGEEYGCTDVVEAHHIDYFTKSLNNDYNNILVVCPNHHSIIHDCDPVFDWNTLKYTYNNGFEEGLILNTHLGNNIFEDSKELP